MSTANPYEHPDPPCDICERDLHDESIHTHGYDEGKRAGRLEELRWMQERWYANGFRSRFIAEVEARIAQLEGDTPK